VKSIKNGRKWWGQQRLTRWRPTLLASLKQKALTRVCQTDWLNDWLTDWRIPKTSKCCGMTDRRLRVNFSTFSHHRWPTYGGTCNGLLLDACLSSIKYPIKRNSKVIEQAAAFRLNYFQLTPFSLWYNMALLEKRITL